MKRALLFVLTMYVVSASADELKVGGPQPTDVIRLATALDHVTVLEFGEPVTMAAAGSPAFQIERHEDKVFIKPLKTGASTDLFVWTASRRFTYELEPPGEVTHMNFAVDNRIATPKPAPDSTERLNEIADMMFTRAFLGAERVDSTNIKDEKGHVTIRMQHVFCSKNTVYIHYSIRNLSGRPYRVSTPVVAEAVAPKAMLSVASIHRMQLDEKVLRKLGKLEPRPLTLARAETQTEDLQPGQDTQGVVAIREQLSAPAIFQLTFGYEGSHRVEAAMVF